jgi:hypothetical protein
MRTELAILVVSLIVGLAVGLLLTFFAKISLFWVCGPTIGLVLGVCLLMAHNAMYTIRELAKQIAVWLAIVVLLPLSVWYGTSAFSPPPDRKKHQKATAKLDEKIREAEKAGEKEKLSEEKDRLEADLDAAERVYYGHMFWVAYPVGLGALIVGTFFRVQAVGSGLMFGGLSSLATGCYSYWDQMGDWLRFGSLVIALAVVLVLGTWRFWPLSSDSPTTA